MKVHGGNLWIIRRMKINANNRRFSLTAQEKGCKVVNVEFEFPWKMLGSMVRLQTNVKPSLGSSTQAEYPRDDLRCRNGNMTILTN